MANYRQNVADKTCGLDLNKRAKGNIGEDIACKFLVNKGFFIKERNYFKKWGEIDIIAERDGRLHFFEVKSVVGEPAKGKLSGNHRPEDNIHGFKLHQLRKMVQTYYVEKEIDSETEFAVHAICVFMNLETRRASVRWIENIII
jgi:putative endonuclease